MDLKKKRLDSLVRHVKMPDLHRLIEEKGIAEFDSAVEGILRPYETGGGPFSHTSTESQKTRLAESIGPFMSYYGIGCEPLTYKEVAEKHSLTFERARGRVEKGLRVLYIHKKDLWYGIVLEEPIRYNGPEERYQ